MKYVIEFEDKPIAVVNGNPLFRAKGFNALVFDSVGLNHLVPLDEEMKKWLFKAFQKINGTGGNE